MIRRGVRIYIVKIFILSLLPSGIPSSAKKKNTVLVFKNIISDCMVYWEWHGHRNQYNEFSIAFSIQYFLPSVFPSYKEFQYFLLPSLPLSPLPSFFSILFLVERTFLSFCLLMVFLTLYQSGSSTVSSWSCINSRKYTHTHR